MFIVKELNTDGKSWILKIFSFDLGKIIHSWIKQKICQTQFIYISNNLNLYFIKICYYGHER